MRHTFVKLLNEQCLSSQKKILIVPLDWGLGHATRCIPIIRHLIEQGCQVFVGGNASTIQLIKGEFPSLTYLPYDGYNMRYSKSPHLFFLKMLRQLPKLARAIRMEQRRTKELVEKYQFDLLISDNRFGVFHSKRKSVFITHQISLKLPWYAQWINKVNRLLIKKFDELWIPDYEDGLMAGDLIKQATKVGPSLRYLGNLSRFRPVDNDATYYSDLLIVLSGPEPQRSMFETLLLEQLDPIKTKLVFVGGSIHGANLEISGGSYFGHLPADRLNAYMTNAAVILTRSGYSSIMDLLKIQKTAILVPTPGQSEQEYLGTLWKEKACFTVVSQKGFDLRATLEQHKKTLSKLPTMNTDQYKIQINKCLED